MVSKDKLNALYEYNKPINWNVSCFGNDSLMYVISVYIDFLKKLKIKNPIKTIHGSYASRYNGGRTAFFIRDNQYIYDKIREFNDLGIGVKLTFSHPYFTKEWFEEKELNEYLEVLSERKDLDNGIICSIDEFANYIHKNYPTLSVTSSYVKVASETRLGKTDTIDYYNKLFDIYDIIVFNIFRAFDDEFLDQIKYKDRIEFIANASCNINCPIAKKHYQINYDFNQRVKWLHDHNIYSEDPKLKIIQEELLSINRNCIKRKNQNNINNFNHRQLNKDEINHLLSLGINRFKIEGRDYDIDTFKYYLFKYIFNNDSILDQLTLIPKDFNLLNDWKAHKKFENGL